MKTLLSRLFKEILAEVDANDAFRSRLQAIIDSSTNLPSSAMPKQPTRPRNRRSRGVLDPYQEFVSGEDYLRTRLHALSVEQLKDIVSEHALDSSRLALKWKSSTRLIDLILNTVRNRLEKGDAFRQEGRG